MTMLRKTLSLFLSLALLAVLAAGCSEKPKNDQPTDPAKERPGGNPKAGGGGEPTGPPIN
jgi:hypothetical protein